MTKVDLRLAGGEVLLPGLGFRRVDVLAADGRIVAVTEPGSGPEAAETVRVDGLTVLPGACDVHLPLGHGSDIPRPRVPDRKRTRLNSRHSCAPRMPPCACKKNNQHN